MRKVMSFIVSCTFFQLQAVCQSQVSPVSYNMQGEVYIQNFDGLPNSGNFSFTGKGPFNLDNPPTNIPGLKGWQFLMTGGTGTNAGFLVSTGSSTTNGVQSLGTAGSTDRALGSLSTSSGVYAFGVILTNNTGIRLNRTTISFTAEQWRKGGSGNRNTWSFHYKTGILTGIDANDLLNETHLNFSSVITTTGAGSLIGNTPENKQNISYTITGIDWRPGEQLLLRWDDTDETGSDDACGIDDLRLTAEQVEDLPSVVNKPVITTGSRPTLNAMVNDNNAATDIIAEYDLSIDFPDPKTIVTVPDHIDAAGGNTNITALLPELTPGTSYYYRIKASNRNGTTTGNAIEFLFPPVIPVLITANPIVQGLTAIILGGSIQTNGGSAILEKGIVWSAGNEPVLPVNKTVITNGSADFSQVISSLPQGTLLYIRAYATNITGIGYGSTMSFITPTSVSSFVSVSPTFTNMQSVIFTLKTVQAISGLGISNFSLDTNGSDGAFVTAITGTGSSYSITVNTGTTDGTIKLVLANNVHIVPPIYNLPITANSFFTIRRSPPRVYKVSIPDKPMKTGDTIPVAINVKADAGIIKFNNIDVGGFPVVNVTKKNDSVYTGNFIIINGGKDISASDPIYVNASTADGLGNVSLYSDSIIQPNDILDANRPFVTGIKKLPVRTYKSGDTLFFAVGFSEKVYVINENGSLYCKLTIGSTSRQANYAGGSGTDSLLFFYIVTANDEDSAGFRLSATISANNSLIKDAVGNNALLSLPLYNSENTKIDGVPPKIAGIAVPADRFYKGKDTMSFIITFSEPIRIIRPADTILLKLTIGSSTKSVFCSRWDNQALYFNYIIQSNDLDKSGITLGMLTTQDSTTITDLAGNPCSLTIRNTRPLNNIKVDAVTPQFILQTDTLLIACKKDSTISLGEILSITDTEKGDSLTWTIAATRYSLAGLQQSFSMVSTGNKMIPGKIFYRLSGTGAEPDTLLATVTDGLNQSKKMIYVTVQAPITNNIITGNVYGCSGSPVTITGATPRGGNGTYEFIWDSAATDSVNFNKLPGSSVKDLPSSVRPTQTTWFRRRVISGSCADTSSPMKLTIVKTGLWLGSFTTEWENPNNWCNAIIPGASTDIVIPENTVNSPSIKDTASCHDIFIDTAAQLAINGSLQLTGNITAQNGSIDLTIGKLIAAGTYPQILMARLFRDGKIKRLTVNNPVGVAIEDSLFLTGELRLISGGLKINGNLIILHTGSLGASADRTFISGEVLLEHIITGKKTSRLLGHPFSKDIELEMIIDGSNSKGILPTADLRMFWYNTPSAVDSLGVDNGWKLFENMTGVPENRWRRYSGIKMLFTDKTPNDADEKSASEKPGTGSLLQPLRLQLKGPVNMGDQEIVLQKTDLAGYNLVANPYASAIDLSLISRTSDVSDHFWIWDPELGIAGGYVALLFRTSYTLPAFGAFFTKAGGSTNNSLFLTENCKVSNVPGASVLSIHDFPDRHLELQLFRENDLMDRLFIYHSDSAWAGYDKFDAEKFMNSNINFFTFSRDKKKLSIDARPLSNAYTIGIGLHSTVKGNFSIHITSSELSPQNTLQLHDKYLNKWMLLEQDSIYSFSITEDTASFGDNRFEISSRPEKNDSVVILKKIIASIGPVPATDKLNIKYSVTGKENTYINIRDKNGYLMRSKTTESKMNGEVNFDINDLLPGIYFVEIRSGVNSMVKKMIKL